MVTAVFALSAVLIVLAIVLYVFVRRRKFYRRNQAGIETFKTYSASVLTPFMEGLLKFISIMLFLAGLFFAGVGYFNL